MHTLLTLFLTVIALPYLACTCLALPGLSWMPQKQVFWPKTAILQTIDCQGQSQGAPPYGDNNIAAGWLNACLPYLVGGHFGLVRLQPAAGWLPERLL